MKTKFFITITLIIVTCNILTACSSSTGYPETTYTTDFYGETEVAPTIEKDTMNDISTEDHTECIDTKTEMLYLSDLVPDFEFCAVGGELRIPVGFQTITDEEILRQKYAIIEKTVFLSDESGTEIAIKYDENLFMESDDLKRVETLSSEMMQTIGIVSSEIEFTHITSYENEKGKAVSVFSFTYRGQNVSYIVAVIKNYTLLINVNSSENDLSKVNSTAYVIANSIEERW